MKNKYVEVAALGMFLGGAVVVAALFFLGGWIVMLLWNWLIPTILGLPFISFWQAIGITLLSGILFKPVPSWSSRNDN